MLSSKIWNMRRRCFTGEGLPEHQTHERTLTQNDEFVSQDRFVMENVVDPTMTTVPVSFSESDTESFQSRPPEVESEPAGLRMTQELRNVLDFPSRRRS